MNLGFGDHWVIIDIMCYVFELGKLMIKCIFIRCFKKYFKVNWIVSVLGLNF